MEGTPPGAESAAAAAAAADTSDAPALSAALSAAPAASCALDVSVSARSELCAATVERPEPASVPPPRSAIQPNPMTSSAAIAPTVAVKVRFRKLKRDGAAVGITGRRIGFGVITCGGA